MEQITNTITIRGELQSLPQFSHENHGRRFYRLILEVPRLSGTIDYLPVITEQRILDQIDPTAGSMLTVTGQIRSHNHRTDGVRHLMIFVFASDIIPEDLALYGGVLPKSCLCATQGILYGSTGGCKAETIPS